MNGVGWIGFYVGWFLVDYYMVNVQCIFIDVVVFWVEVWYVEWVVSDIVVVVDILFGLEVDNIVSVLNDCFFCWIGFQVVWIGVVYIVIFMDQLFQFVVLFYF